MRPAMQVCARGAQRTIADIAEKLVDLFDIRFDDQAGIFTHILPESLDYLIVKRLLTIRIRVNFCHRPDSINTDSINTIGRV